MAKLFLIDTDVIFQAKNFHYKFEFCDGFWKWLEAGNAEGIIYSIEKVRTEILVGNKKDDMARKWVQTLSADFFLADVTDQKVMAHYTKLMKWAASHGQYQAAAVKEFAEAQRADAFLVACAKAHDAIVVTHEKLAPEAKRRIPIPNAANAFGVETKTIFELLSEHAGANFKFKH